MVVRLALIVTALTLTLNRSRVHRNLKIRVSGFLNVIFQRFLGTRLTDNLHRTLVSSTVRLLTIVTQLLTFS